MSSALIGVVIATATTLTVLAIQLWANSRQRERDRHMQLKRDVYMEAAEGLAATVAYIMEHTRTDVPLGAVKPPSERPGWLFKIHLVASTPTLIAFNKASVAAAAATMDVFVHRIGVAEVNDEIAVVQSSLERLQTFQEEIRSEAHAVDVNVAPERALKRLEQLQKQIDDSWVQIREQSAELEKLTIDHAERTRTVLKRGFVVSADVNRAVRLALLAAREELGVTIDIDKFEAAASEVDRQMTDAIDNVLAQLR